MRIGIDTQALAGKKSGLGIYTDQLVSHLKQIDRQNEYVLLVNRRKFGERTYDRLVWENFSLAGEARKEHVGILHTPAFSVPFVKGNWRSVVTIHDLIGIIFPGHLSFPSRCYWAHWLPFVNRRSERIIVDSNCTKQDVIKYLKVDPQKIRVVHLAASDRFKKSKTSDEIQMVCAQYGISRPYLLYVGNIEPRKNLVRVLKAFSELKKKRNIEHQLVLAGSRTWRYPILDHLIQEYGLSKSIKCLNYIDDEALISLYNGTELLVFPSLYEGFGMPILEAMQCGVPVLTSKLSSIPEVAGDAAYYVDPYRAEEIEDGIWAVLSDKALSESLRQKGFVQAAKFSWKLTAEKTLAVYEELKAES